MLTFNQILLHLCCLLARIQTLIEACGIEFQSAGLVFQVRNLELLGFEQRIMKLPELALRSSAASCFRGFLSERMHGKRQILVNHGNLIAELRLQEGQFDMDLLAIGAFVVRKLYQLDWSIRRTLPECVRNVDMSAGLAQRNDHAKL